MISATSDWLSQLLATLPVSGKLDVRCALGAPWRLENTHAAPGEMPYHVVLRGQALLETPAAAAPQPLQAGDIVLLPHGSAHALHDGSGGSGGPMQMRDTASRVAIRENGGGGARLDMLCGHFRVAQPHDRLMRAYLPPVLIVRSTDTAVAVDASDTATPTSLQLTSMVALMRAEAGTDNLGARAMLDALSTALFALILRKACEAGAASHGMLALAAHPRLAPALSAMLHRPAAPWTLPELARLCNMSRATLVRQFQDKLGRSASELLADIRMSIAATALRAPGASTEAVAEAVGYDSVAAFRRAFARRMGTTPGEWRRGPGPQERLPASLP